MNLANNPLRLPLLALLQHQPGPLTEYQLMTALDDEYQHLHGLSDSASLRLFQKHFLLMNALYQLQATLAEENLQLHISALSIHITPLDTSQHQPAQAGSHTLRDYYLNGEHLLNTGENEVAQLLDSFWTQFDKYQQRHPATGDCAAAYAALGLDAASTTWEDIKATYRRRIADTHPDKGGNTQAFIALRGAYEVLRARHQPL